MFPEAPPPIVPITMVEDTDLDAILINFPNHLIIGTVMEHFCRSVGSDSSERGYMAPKMAERLLVHRNRHDDLNAKHGERIDTLVAWIRKMKLAATDARRKRQIAGQSVELVPLEGQCIDLDIGQGGEEDTVGGGDDGEGLVPLGSRLAQDIDTAVADYRKMMRDRANDSMARVFGDKAVEDK